MRKPASMWDLATEGLSVHEMGAVTKTTYACEYAPRAQLYREGAPCTCVSIVEHGRVRSYHSAPDGKEFTNLVSGSGALLGFVSIVLDVPAVISVESIDPVLVSQIHRTDLLALMAAIPRLCLNFNRMLAATYLDGIARSRRSTDSAPVRLGKVLFQLAMLEAGEPETPGGEIHGLTQQDLAAMVDTTRSWVAQMLASLEHLGLIHHRRGVIRIPDLPRLLDHVALLEASRKE